MLIDYANKLFLFLDAFVSTCLAVAFDLACTRAARPIHIQAVVVGVERIETAGVHEGGKVGVPHFLDFAACGADQVGVG